MEDIKELFQNPWISAFAWMVAGIVVTIIANKMHNKTGLFRYTLSYDKLGMSADDHIFGDVRATWKGTQVSNLYLYTIELENSTSTDYENIEFHVYSGDDTIILTERTGVVDSPNIIKWSDAFEARMSVPEGEQPDEQATKTYSHRREYELPVINRGQKLRFQYLCTKPNDFSDNPGIYIHSPSKGIKLKQSSSPSVVINPIWGVPVPVAIARALILSVLVVLACGIWIESIWAASIIAMVFGLSAQQFGALFYKAERFIWNSVAG
jgi:hypothetical protein